MADLEGRGIEIEKHDLAKEPPSRELLEKLVDESHLDDFLNKRSPAYKERGLEGRKLTKAEAIRLMMEEPNLIRRPLVLAKGKALFVYDAGEYERLAKK